MEGILDAIRSFLDGLTTIQWAPLGLAVLCHLGRVVARTRAWRNVVAAAYPDKPVRYRDVFGSYSAGIGANALLPGRGGDLLRLYLIKHRVEGSTYPTLGATLLADTLFDAVVGSILLSIALATGVLPGLDVLPSLPGVDWLWFFRNPTEGLLILAVVTAAVLLAVVLAAHRVRQFWARVRQGLAILRDPRRYLRTVVPWQALDWTFRAGSIFFFLQAFGLPETVRNIFAVQVTQALSTLLPLTPAGIGTEQALLVFIFAGEASTSDVLSFSVGVKIVIVIVNVALGALATFAMIRRFRWRQAVSEDAAEVK